MKLTILGMNGPFPAAGGCTSGYLVTADGAAIVIDLGSGCLGQLSRCAAPEGLNALLLTHWHYDHCADVLPLIFRLEACARKPLHVYAPADENSPVRQAVQQCARIILHDVTPGEEFRIPDSEFRIFPFPARHPVPALMYRVECGGKVLCCTGDTNTVAGLTDFAQGADLLLADGLFPAALWAEGKPHLSAAHCAQLAKDANAKQLVITHLNPMLDPETLLKEARAIRIDSKLARMGDTYEI